MTEIIKEFIGIYKNKTKLPIVSTYIILLIIWNWDIISIYLFASKDIETRIETIGNMVTWWKHILRIMCPLGIAFAYPFISEFLMDFTDSKLKGLRKNRRTLKNQEEKDKAQNKFDISELESGKRTVDELMEQIKESNVQRDTLSQRIIDNEKFHEEEIKNLKEQVHKLRNSRSSDLEQLKNQKDLIFRDFPEHYNNFNLHYGSGRAFVDLLVNLHIEKTSTFHVSDEKLIPVLRNFLSYGYVFPKSEIDNLYTLSTKGIEFVKYLKSLKKIHVFN